MRSLHDPLHANDVLDPSALVLFFPAPKSFTGDDVLELHLHGGSAIVKAVLAAIGKCHGAGFFVKYAEPGEFTQRAFFNDRLDLTQVEALGDTLAAVTEEQRRLSVSGGVNGLATQYESWRQSLLLARGELEALIDFSEDQHFDESPTLLAASVARQIQHLADMVSLYIANAGRGQMLRTGIAVSLLGVPNVGKSSILNRVVGRNAAIVSREAGTTRDVVEIGLDLGGFYCRVGDTAGLRQSKSTDLPECSTDIIGDIEREGIERAKANASEAQVVVLVLSVEPSTQQGAKPRLVATPDLIKTAVELRQRGKRLIVVVNKMDLLGPLTETMERLIQASLLELLPAADMVSGVYCVTCQQPSLGASSRDGPDGDPDGFRTFVDGLIGEFKAMTSPLVPDGAGSEVSATWEASLGATERQRMLLESCLSHLRSFLAQITPVPVQHALESSAELDITLAAEHLRIAAESLAKITGRVTNVSDVEEVLGVVFEK